MTSPNAPALRDLLATLRHKPLFHGLSAQQVSQVSAMLRQKNIPHGEYVFHAGERSDELFIIVSGEVELLKEEPETGKRHRLMTLGTGASFGEGALYDAQVRTVSVRALGDCDVLALRIEDLHALPSVRDTLAARIKLNLGAQMARNLRELSDTTAKSLQELHDQAGARAKAEIFVTTTFVAICAYVFLLQAAVQYIHGKAATLALTIPSFAFFILLFLHAVKRSGQPLATYGVTTKCWKKAVLEACIFSVPIMMLAVFAKWMMIKFLPGMQDEELFGFMHNPESGGGMKWIEVAAYVFFSPFQEFVVRGTMQGAFEDFLTGRHRVLKAILAANVVYSMLHLYMSLIFSAMVFIPGLVWGWLYSRHRTLIGVSLSHALCGVFAFFVVGFDTLIQMYG